MLSPSQKRIVAELTDITKNPPEGVTVEGDPSNQFKWIIYLAGPKGTAYESGVFKIQCDFPDSYPFKSPTVKFVTKIYHPNVKFDNGEICHEIYQKDWVPTKKTKSIVDLLISMLMAPNLDAPTEPTIAEEYRSNRATFNKKAQEYTLQYAKGV